MGWGDEKRIVRGWKNFGWVERIKVHEKSTAFTLFNMNLPVSVKCSNNSNHINNNNNTNNSNKTNSNSNNDNVYIKMLLFYLFSWDLHYILNAHFVCVSIQRD